MRSGHHPVPLPEAHSETNDLREVRVTGAFLTLPLVALIAVSLQPELAYSDAGVSNGLVTGLLIVTCASGAAVYFPVIRPLLRRGGLP